MTYFDLGTYSRQVTTASPAAQEWFDRGLIWTYAYNHEEAIACFERALEADPHCAMAHWGVAYAIGPNYNKPWEAFEEDEKPDALEQAKSALAQALKLTSGLSPFEKALIDALVARYPDDASVENFAPWNDAYADAMRSVYRAHRDDLDVSCLFAEAIMNRTPWQLWDLPTGMPAIQDRANLLYTYGVSRGNLDIRRFVDAVSTRSAHLFGLEQKGQIAVGKDADLVVYDPSYRGKITLDDHHVNNDYSAFEGFESVW